MALFRNSRGPDWAFTIVNQTGQVLAAAFGVPPRWVDGIEGGRSVGSIPGDDVCSCPLNTNIGTHSIPAMRIPLMFSFWFQHTLPRQKSIHQSGVVVGPGPPSIIGCHVISIALGKSFESIMQCFLLPHAINKAYLFVNLWPLCLMHQLWVKGDGPS